MEQPIQRIRARVSISIVSLEGNRANVDSIPVNNTASIPLSSSWNSSTVTIKSFKRVAPNAKNFALWADPTSKKMYAWGGAGPYNNRTGSRNKQLWAFTPDDAGAGTWAASVPANPAIATSIIRATLGAATTCNGVGYYLGGEASINTDADVSSYTLPPGLLAYDMSTATWTNHSAPTPYSTLLYGRGTCLPFGNQGLVAFFGGGYRNVDRADSFQPILFNNITFFDPSTKTWSWQLTTGELPVNRNQFCSVGVAGPNGTFEM